MKKTHTTHHDPAINKLMRDIQRTRIIFGGSIIILAVILSIIAPFAIRAMTLEAAARAEEPALAQREVPAAPATSTPPAQ